MDLTDIDLLRAKPDRGLTQALLQRMAHVARPGTGSAKVLLVLAYAAQSDWFEGGMRVELDGDEDVTVVEVLSELGSTESIFAAFSMRVSIEEMRRAILLQPSLVLPLTLKRDQPSKIVLSVRANERISLLAPSVIEVGPLEISPPFGSLQPPQSVEAEISMNPSIPRPGSPIRIQGMRALVLSERPTLPTRMVPHPSPRLARVPPRPSSQPTELHPGSPEAPTNIDFSQANKNKGLSGRKPTGGK